MVELQPTRLGLCGQGLLGALAVAGVWLGPWQGWVRIVAAMAVAVWAAVLFMRAYKVPMHTLGIDGDPVLDGNVLRGATLELWGPWLLLGWRESGNKTGRMQRRVWWLPFNHPARCLLRRHCAGVRQAFLGRQGA